MAPMVTPLTNSIPIIAEAGGVGLLFFFFFNYKVRMEFLILEDQFLYCYHMY